MPSILPSQRHEPARSQSWPPTIRLVPGDEAAYKAKAKSAAPTSQTELSKPKYDLFDDNIDDHPEDHFLSPVQMYEYEDWADDSGDDDAEEVEWDAGITDFALFDDDRRRAEARHEPLPSRWNDMLEQQASALQRAVERNRVNSVPDAVNREFLPPLDDEIPSLTPDTSPNLRDDVDVDSFHGQPTPRPSVPHYLNITVTPPDEDIDAAVEEDEDLPLSFYMDRRQLRRSSPDRRLERRFERPGLRHSRTMSGKVHVWKRPSFHIYTVGEDAEAERRAELGMIRKVEREDDGKSGSDRGRR